jgi:type II secretion system protein N
MASVSSKWVDRLARMLPRRAPARSTLLYALWTATWFLLFLALTFPHELIARHYANELESASGWRLRFGDVRMRPWSGYHVAQMQVIAPGENVDPVLSAQEVVVRPSLLRLLLGRGVFPVYFSGEAYAGTFSGSFDRAAGLDLDWGGLRLGDYPRLSDLVEGNWSGELSGQTHLAGQGELRTLRGRGTVTLRNAALTQGRAQGFAIPDLHFASGDCQFELKNGRLDLRSLKLSGAELDAELSGQVFLTSSANMPVVSATLTLRPIPGAAGGFEALLSLLNRNPQSPGSPYTFTLYGPVNAIRAR